MRARPVALLLGVALAVTACASDPEPAATPGGAPQTATAGGATTGGANTDGAAATGEATANDGAAATGEGTGGTAGSDPTSAAAVAVVAGAAATTPGRSDDAVYVGGLVSATDPVHPAQAGADVGARARFARANAGGGVHGRRIELVEVLDDAGDPARAAAAVRRLVDADGVLAVVPVVSNVLTPEVRAILAEAGVPSFGWGPDFCDAGLFGITGCWPAAAAADGTGLGEALASPAFVAAVAAAIAPGATTMVVGHAGPLGQAAVDRVVQQATAQGLRVVAAEASIPVDTPVDDFTPWADRILTADGGRPPQLLIHTEGVVDVLALSYQLRQRDYPGAQANPRTYDPALALTYPLRYRLEGGLVGTPFTPVETTDSPAMAQAAADLQAAGVAADSVGLPALLAGYWAADLFLQLLEAAGPDPTPAALVAAADGFTYDGGGVGPSTWPAAHASPVPCTHLLRITGFTFENGLPGGRYDVVSPRSCT